MSKYLLYLPIFLSWSIPIFIYKNLTTYLSNLEIVLLNHLFWDIIVFGSLFIYYIYDTSIIDKFIDSYKTIPNKNILQLVFAVMLSFISQICYYKLLKITDVSFFIPIIKGVSTLLIVFIAYYLYREKLSLLKTTGILFIILGIYIVNKK